MFKKDNSKNAGKENVQYYHKQWQVHLSSELKTICS